jgi:hypothetical protein
VGCPTCLFFLALVRYLFHDSTVARLNGARPHLMHETRTQLP